MEWIDEGIVLASRRHGESSAVVTALTAGHGRHAGLVRGSRKGGGTYEPGNLVRLKWRARLDEHLGSFTGELRHSTAAALMDDPARLSALTAACALVDSGLPEREPHGNIHRAMTLLLETLESGAALAWQAAYVRFERDLLTDLGFGLDLSRCAATGLTGDLAYVSPNTGRAVSRGAGAPYREKLFPLPPFLADAAASPQDETEIAAGLALTGHFLERHVYAPHGKPLPPARARFVDRIAKFADPAPVRRPG